VSVRTPPLSPSLLDKRLSSDELKLTVPKAVDIATRSNDGQLQHALVAGLSARGSGVPGQQRLLAALAPVAGQNVASGAGTSSTQWLDTATPAIGKTIAKLNDLDSIVPGD
jgi:hypothetical protein